MAAILGRGEKMRENVTYRPKKLHKLNAYEARAFLVTMAHAALAPTCLPLGGGRPSRQDYDQ